MDRFLNKELSDVWKRTASGDYKNGKKTKFWSNVQTDKN